MMEKVAVTGAGSAPANGVINSLKKQKDLEVIGLGSDCYDLSLCNADRKVLIPHSTKQNYKKKLLDVLEKYHPDMIHFQHDKELMIAAKFQKEIHELGIKTFIPDFNTIDTCVHKYKSWLVFKENNIKVPENIVINEERDLKQAFDKLIGNHDGIWIRSMAVGGGGIGALAAHTYEEAFEWIDKRNGWGNFVAAELLTDKTVTWQSVWNHGELIVAQGRKRHSWAFGALSPSGVTGVTRVCETMSDSIVDSVGMAACKAVSKEPHGVYGVDMTYDIDGIPNPTEINIGRFFTTVPFFAEVGLNLPLIIKDLCLYDKKPNIEKKLNPLPDGMIWVRGMDTKPRLFSNHEEMMKGIDNYT